MVGSAILRALARAGFNNLATATREELDLRDGVAVERFMKSVKPRRVILCAAKVGGIEANRSHPAQFLYDNLAIQTNVIHQAYLAGVQQLVFLGSSCVYPRECPQPMKEEYFLTGPLEPTNEAYAIAKIAGARMAQFYEREYGLKCICPMPCNLYGPNDSFHPLHSHVLAALVKKFVDAMTEGRDEVLIWGTGVARREFLHVDDLALAVLLLMERWPTSDIINVGSGTDVSIRQLAEMVAGRVGFRGQIAWDPTKPDGMPRKCLDISKIRALGFTPQIPLEHGVDLMIADYKRMMSAAGYVRADR